MDPDEIDLQVHRAAKLLELESLLDRKPKTLSGGQLQRVALGRAIVRNPDVFLLDEPLSNLDAKFRTNMRLQISRLHQKLNATFIYVTHDQTEAMTMADRIVIMKDGEIQQADTPKELYYHPANAFVAGFLGQPQMNFVKSILTKKEQHYQVSFNGYVISLPDNKETDKLVPYVNKTVLLGLRPEDVSPDSDFFKEHSVNRFFGKVTDISLVESDIFLTVECNGEYLTARAASTCPLHSNVTAEFAVNASHLHLFDPDTKESICHLNTETL